MNPIKIFISYSHDDVKYLTDIKTYLDGIESAEVEVWDDGEIKPGEKWDEKIKFRLKEANIIVLLISQTFLNSVYINEVELQFALDDLEGQNENIPVVIPIFVRTCPLDGETDKKILALQGYPRFSESKRRFLSEMGEDIYYHLTDIHNGISERIETIKQKRKEKEISKEKFEKLSQIRNNFQLYLVKSNSKEAISTASRFLQFAGQKSEYNKWPFEISNDLNKAIYLIFLIASEDDLNNQEIAGNLIRASDKVKSDRFFRYAIWLGSEELKEKLNPGLNGIPIAYRIESLFEIIEGFEIERRKKIAEIESEYNLPTKRAVMIYEDSDRDNDYRICIKKKIEEKKLYSLRLSPSKQTLAELKGILSNCEAAFLIYGNADRDWFAFRQDLLIDTQLKKKILCLPLPDIQKRLDSEVSVNQFNVIIRQDNIDCSKIDDSL